MIGISEQELVEKLRGVGWLGPTQPVVCRNLVRNPLRKDYSSRFDYRVDAEGGGSCIVMVGPDLADLHTRSAKFAAACPGITCPPLFWSQADGYQLLGIECFDGVRIDVGYRSRRFPLDSVLWARRSAEAGLRQSEKASTSECLEEELRGFFGQVVQVGLFGQVDCAWLWSVVFPLVLRGALSQAPTRRWTNGDFIAGNILHDGGENVRIVDYEFAEFTHFHRADAWRWRMFSDLPLDTHTEISPGSSKYEESWIDCYCILQQLLFLKRTYPDAIVYPDATHLAEDLVKSVAGGYSEFRGEILFPAWERVAVRKAARPEKVACQLYWSDSAEFDEERSLKYALEWDQDQAVRFSLPYAIVGSLYLRFDPADCSGLVEVSRICVLDLQRGGTLLEYNGSSGWGSVRICGDQMMLSNSETLRIIAWNDDPQLHFPHLVLEAETQLQIEVQMNVTQSARMLASGFLAGQKILLSEHEARSNMLTTELDALKRSSKQLEEREAAAATLAAAHEEMKMNLHAAETAALLAREEIARLSSALGMSHSELEKLEKELTALRTNAETSQAEATLLKQHNGALAAEAENQRSINAGLRDALCRALMVNQRRTHAPESRGLLGRIRSVVARLRERG